MSRHVTGSQSLIVQGKYLSMKYFVQLSVCMDVCMDVPFCLLCMHNLYMYICICMLSTVGTGILTCSIIVIFVILNFKKLKLILFFKSLLLDLFRAKLSLGEVLVDTTTKKNKTSFYLNTQGS